MKNLKINTIILGSTLFLSMGLTAQPFHSANCSKHGPATEFHVKHANAQFERHEMIQHLDLSDDQKTKIEALSLAHKKKALPLQNELNEKRARIKTLETNENADIKAINSLIDEMSVIKTTLAKEKALMHQELRNILTEEQRLKFDMDYVNRNRDSKPGHNRI